MNGELTISSAGIAGRVEGTVSVGNVPDFTLTADLAIAVNTTTEEVGDLPAGPYLRIDAANASLVVAGQTLSGNFAFEKTTDESAATVIRIGVSDASFSLGGGVATLSNGQGNVLLSRTGGVTFEAGRLSGDVALHIPGVSLTGSSWP